MASQTPSREISLADVLAAVDACDLPERRRQDLASAVRTVARLLGREPSAIPADPAALGRRLGQVSYAAAGMSRGRWANVRSLFRKALDLVRPVMAGRSVAPLSPEWKAVWSALPTKSQKTRLSRVCRYFSAKGVDPGEVTLDALLAFRDVLLRDALLPDAERTWGDTARAWNSAAGRVEGVPAIEIPIVARREIYILPWEAFPSSLKADVDGWLARLAGKDLSDDGPARPARPGTLETREYQLRSFASVLVRRGSDPASLRTLADLVAYDAYVDGLRFFYERAGCEPSSRTGNLASMLRSVARYWVKVDEATLARMGQLVRKLSVSQEGLTEKNRERLRAFDDEAKVDALLRLPQDLRREVERGTLTPRRAAVRAGLAVAIELLLVAPVRRQNLAAIDLERHLVRTGRKLHLVVPGREVKNAQDLEFELPERTAELIDWYLREHRPVLLRPGCTALFPSPSGKAKRDGTLGLQIHELVFARTGLKVNPHLFRHIGAKLFLDAVPGGYEVIRRVLGHKSIATTTSFYAGAETAAAVRHFDAVVLGRQGPDRPEPRKRGATTARDTRKGASAPKGRSRRRA
jgi:integrase